MIVADVIQKVQLVEGQFSPDQAAQVVISLLDQKINFHKLNRLSMWIGNHDLDTEYTDIRIKELEIEKQVAKELVKEAKASGSNLRINGT
ncbi:MAG: hypothetical protein HKN45_06330, partial [Flavobacteriales bacterium]|nr:hypothetical protein [Flavobacteriales bacterium]